MEKDNTHKIKCNDSCLKKILIAAMFVAGGYTASAQTTGGVTGAGQGTGTTSGRPSTSKTTKGATPKVATKHGTQDHTPGSPVGTGGTGDNMSGSRKNSALESSVDRSNQQDSMAKTPQQNSGQRATKKSGSTKRINRSGQ